MTSTKGATASGAEEKSREECKRRLISYRAAAAYLSVSYWTVRGMVDRGELPVVRAGRRRLIDIRDLNAWIERQKEKN